MERSVSIAVTGGFSEATEPISLAAWVKGRENEDSPAASGCPAACLSMVFFKPQSRHTPREMDCTFKAGEVPLEETKKIVRSSVMLRK